MRTTERAHEAIRQVVRSGETVVDATLGNGHDTLFLAQLVGEKGRVIGFDVQDSAVEATRRRLLEGGISSVGGQVHLSPMGHEFLNTCVNGEVAAVMFNLGYLPGGDHAIATQPETTVSAIAQSWELLRGGGIISIVCYRGHPGALAEANAVERWIRTSEAGRSAVVCTSGQTESETGPYLLTLEKRSED